MDTSPTRGSANVRIDAPAEVAFAYEVPPDFEYAAVWSHLVEPDGDGCTVTESFHAPLLEQPEIYPGKIEGRRDQLQLGCETTLANPKAALEGR